MTIADKACCEKSGGMEILARLIEQVNIVIFDIEFEEQSDVVLASLFYRYRWPTVGAVEEP